MRSAIAMLTLLAALAAASAANAADRVLVADIAPNLAAAQRIGAPPDAQRLRIGVVLAHPHPAQEDALLAGLFDRSSPDYHQFLTPAQYALRFGVTDATQRATRAWLSAGGLDVENVSGAGDYFLASGTIGQIEALLKTTIGNYRIAGKTFDSNDRPPSVPRSLPIYDVLGLDTTKRHHTMAGLNGLTADTPTPARSRPRSCARSTSTRRASPARASRWRSSATARPTR